MSFFTNFLLIAIVFGPGLAISYGLEEPIFQPAAHLFTLLVIEIISIAVVYEILYFLPTDIRFKNMLLDRVANHIHKSRKNMVTSLDNISKLFKKNFGELGFDIALGLLSFAYGVYVSAAVAYALKVRLKRAMIAISLGALVSIIFWWLVAVYTLTYAPIMVFVVVTVLSIAFMIYGWTRENKIIERIAEEILEQKDFVLQKGDHLTKHVKKIIDKEREHQAQQ
jgi:uncharacterized membrane protein